jgi:hypothetical protein
VKFVPFVSNLFWLVQVRNEHFESNNNRNFSISSNIFNANFVTPQCPHSLLMALFGKSEKHETIAF